jgi:nitrogen regulatory protein PII
MTPPPRSALRLPHVTRSDQRDPMTPMKRVEIVVGALELSEVSGVLDQAGVPGYTVLRDVTGKGDRGDRTGDDALTGELKNGYIFCACTEAQARAVAEAVRPVLQRVGGVCLITDCMWVEH